VIGNLVRVHDLRCLHRDGQQDGVNQCPEPFGLRRPRRLSSSVLMFLMTLCRIGVNTLFPEGIAVAILGQFGVPDTWLVEIIIITL